MNNYTFNTIVNASTKYSGRDVFVVSYHYCYRSKSKVGCGPCIRSRKFAEFFQPKHVPSLSPAHPSVVGS